jgi:hypothetical protein
MTGNGGCHGCGISAVSYDHSKAFHRERRRVADERGDKVPRSACLGDHHFPRRSARAEYQ